LGRIGFVGQLWDLYDAECSRSSGWGLVGRGRARGDRCSWCGDLVFDGVGLVVGVDSDDAVWAGVILFPEQ